MEKINEIVIKKVTQSTTEAASFSNRTGMFFYTWTFKRKRDVFVVAILFIVPIEVRDSRDPVRDRRDFLDDGERETFAIGTKTPYFGLHSKYLRIVYLILKHLFRTNYLRHKPYTVNRAIIFAASLIKFNPTPISGCKLCFSQITQNSWTTAETRWNNNSITQSQTIFLL